MVKAPDSYTVSRWATARRVWDSYPRPRWARPILYLYALALPARKRTVEITYNGKRGTT